MRRDQLNDENRAAMCDGKAAFDSAKTAHAVAKRSRHPVEAYRCLACNRWHIGNPPKPRQIRNRNGVRGATA